MRPRPIARLCLNTEVLAGPGAFEACLRECPPGTVALVDGGLPRVEEVADSLARRGIPARRLAGDIGVSTVRAAIDWARGRSAPAAHLVAVGGGSTIDVAKLAAALLASGGELDSLTGRAGLLMLPALPNPPTPRVGVTAVPTTVGTATEVSAVACVDLSVGRRTLVQSPRLRPVRAGLDPVLVETLPRALIREGALEALFRALGPEVGSDSSVALAGVEARFLIGELSGQLTRLADPGAEYPTAAHEIACLSLTTQRGWTMSGRDPYAHPLWYVANELSMITGVAKMRATAALFGGWVARVRAGDRRWGHLGRLSRVWAAITDTVPLSELGARHLLHGWRIENRIAAVDPAHVAELTTARCLERWGGRFPMLGGMDVDDLTDLVRTAVRATGAIPAAGAEVRSEAR